MKRIFAVVGCVACWIATAFFAFLETLLIYLWISGTLYIIKWGAEENPYAAENAWAAGVFSSVTALPFLAALALAIHFTIKLKKRGKQREHSMPDKW